MQVDPKYLYNISGPPLSEIKENNVHDPPIRVVPGLSETQQPFSTKNDSLRDHMTQFVNQRIIQLQNQLVDRELEVSSLQGKLSQVKMLDAKLEIMTNENQQLKQQNNSLENTRRGLESKLVCLNEENDNLKEQLYQESFQRTQIEDQIKSFHQEKLLVNQFREQSDLKNQKKRESELQAELAKTQSEMKNLRTLLELRESELTSAREQVKQSKVANEIELKLKLSQEHGQKLEQYLKEKMKQIEMLEKQVTRLSGFEEDNRLLQNDLLSVTSALEQVQQEHKNIQKFQSQHQEQQNDKIQKLSTQLEQFKQENHQLVIFLKNIIIQKEQIDSKASIFIKKEEEICELKKKLYNSKLQLEEQLSQTMQSGEKKFGSMQKEIEELKLQISSLNKEREALLMKVREMSNEIMRLKDQESNGFEDLRLKVETQVYQDRVQERFYWESQVRKHQESNLELQEKYELLFENQRKLKQENDDIKEQLGKMNGNQYQVVTLDAISKNQQIEIEKLKQSLFQKSQENEQLKQVNSNLDSCQNYVCELERKVSYLMNENQRLNSVIMQRCKNSF